MFNMNNKDFQNGLIVGLAKGGNAAVASSGISEVPSNYVWELESGVYHVSQSIFYSQNAEGEQELIFCKDGYIVIAIDDFTHRRNFRLFANDGKVYYGYSEPHLINTDNGTQTIVNSNLETLDLSNYATKDEIPSLEGYAKTSDIPDVSAYQTEAEVIALINANMPASAEEVEY
jgi:hypothetical protein